MSTSLKTSFDRLIRYNISGCPILCFRFCVSIPMRHFDDLKLHNFTHKLIFWEREIKNFPDGSHFPHLHGYWWRQFLVWLEGFRNRNQCEGNTWTSEMWPTNVKFFQCKICFNEAKMPKTKSLLLRKEIFPPATVQYQIIQRPNALDGFLSTRECCPPTAMQNLFVRGQNTTSSH